jgi:ABC-type branched-subunit amino acid transport system ATPase component/ABC-type branched-subunit amino acid transport system permease subunit
MVLGLILIVTRLGSGLPLGIAGLGVVAGCVLGLQSMGIVLLYSRTRVLSFAQFGLGAMASVLFFLWVLYNQFAVLLNAVLLGNLGPRHRSMGWLQHHPDVFRGYLLHRHPWVLVLNVVASAALALWIARAQSRWVFGIVAGAFARAPRIVPTVATLAIATMLSGAPSLITLRTGEVFGFHIWSWFPYGPRPGSGVDGKPALPEGVFHAPGRALWETTMSAGARFHLYDFLAIGAALLGCVVLTVRFRLGRRGLVSRATASNAERAATLGIDVVRETRDPWVVAGVLSGMSGVLAIAMSTRLPAAGIDIFGITIVLAAVVLARLTSPTLALATTVALCVLEQGMFWNFHSHVQFQASLVVIIGAALLIQRGRTSRAERDAESVFTSAPEPLKVPAALRGAPGVRGLFRWTGVTVALFALSYPLVTTPGQLSLGIGVLGFMVVGTSLLVLSGWAGQVSLGQLALAAVGGYVVAIAGATWHVPMPFALVLGALAAAAVAPFVGVPALRLPGPFVAIMTLAFGLAVPAVLLSGRMLGSALPKTLPRPVMLGLDFGSDRYFFWFGLLVLMAALAIVTGLRRSRLRRVLIAARDNPLAAASFGLDITRLRIEAFAVAGLLAGLGGGLLAYARSGVEVESFSAANSIVLFLIVVIGGLSAVSGPVLGATLFGFMLNLGAGFIGFMNGWFTVVVLALRPAGLAGVVTGLRDAAIRVIMHLQGNDLIRFRGRDGEARIPVADRGAQAPVVPVRYRLVGDGYAPVEGTRLRPVDGHAPDEIVTEELASQVDDALAVLACHRLDVAYGGAVAVTGVTLTVAPGEVLAVVGLNGAGKTSLLRALAGLEPAAHGTVHLDGEDVTRLFPQDRAARGLAYVAGSDAVLPTLTVRENLALAGDDATEMFERFPILEARLDAHAGDLSGGEQHVLALAQGFLRRPRVLLIDELSLGLSAETLATVHALLAELTRDGVAVVLVEQSINAAMAIADSALFLESGRVRYHGGAQALRDHPELFASIAFGAGGAVGGGSELARARRVAQADREPVLRAEHVTAAYGVVRVVDDVTFDVAPGEVVGILGPNGAGKTSLFDCLSGALAMRDGSVTLADEDITKLSSHKRAQLGLMRSFQNVRLFPSLTVRDCIAVALETRLSTKNPVFAGLWLPQARNEERRVDERVGGLLELLRLDAVADVPVASLSLGSRRMVDLACQLAARPKVLLLDEPASGLAHGEVELLGPLVTRISSDLDCAVLIIEHNIAVLASVTQRLIAMRFGAVIADAEPSAVLTDPEVRAAYFGKELVAR